MSLSLWMKKIAHEYYPLGNVFLVWKEKKIHTNAESNAMADKALFYYKACPFIFVWRLTDKAMGFENCGLWGHTLNRGGLGQAVTLFWKLLVFWGKCWWKWALGDLCWKVPGWFYPSLSPKVNSELRCPQSECQGTQKSCSYRTGFANYCVFNLWIVFSIFYFWYVFLKAQMLIIEKTFFFITIIEFKHRFIIVALFSSNLSHCFLLDREHRWAVLHATSAAPSNVKQLPMELLLTAQAKFRTAVIISSYFSFLNVFQCREPFPELPLTQQNSVYCKQQQPMTKALLHQQNTQENKQT